MKNMGKKDEVRKICTYIDETGIYKMDSEVSRLLFTSIETFLSRKNDVTTTFLTDQRGFRLTDKVNHEELIVTCTPNYLNPEQVSIELINMAGCKIINYDIYFDEKTVTIDKMEKTISLANPFVSQEGMDVRSTGVHGRNTTSLFVDSKKKYEESYAFSIGKNPQERTNGSKKTITCYLSNGETLRSEKSIGEVSSLFENRTVYEEGNKRLSAGEFATKLDAFKGELTKTNAKVFTRGTLGIK